MLRLDSWLADLSLFRGFAGAFELERVAGRTDVDLDGTPICELPTQSFCEDRVLDPLLNDPLQQHGPVGWIVDIQALSYEENISILAGLPNRATLIGAT